MNAWNTTRVIILHTSDGIVRGCLALCLMLTAFLLMGCEKNPADPGGRLIPETFLFSPYEGPISWHPDGKWLLTEYNDSLGTDAGGYVRYTSGLSLVNVQTAQTIPIPELQGYWLAAWNADGTQVALVKDAQIYTVDVLQMDPPQFDTTTVRQLTFEGRNFSPHWSPDNEWIAYRRSICEGPQTCGTWICRPTGEDHRFIAAYGTYSDWNPVTPDELIFSRSHNDSTGSRLGTRLYRYNLQTADTDQLAYLSDRMGDHRHFTFAPGGSDIAYLALPYNDVSGIWLMNADGTHPRQVTPKYSMDFDWSPDGTQLVFRKYAYFEALPGNGHLWLINRDGSGVRQLTK